jgi:histidinol-phosphatase (PHP family)
MRDIADYHTHSCFSDGEGEPGDLVRRAVELGLSELGICDHLVPEAYDEPGYGVDHARLGDYVRAVRAAGEEAAGLRVLVGLEIDFIPGTEEEIEALVKPLVLDYAVLSVHFVGSLDLADELRWHDEHWRDADRVVREYYRLLARAVSRPPTAVTVVGHLDVPTRSGHRPASQPREEQERTLRAVAASGLAMEVNTDGSAWPGPDPATSRWLLRRAHDLGVPVTFGSDAHEPSEVGAGFADAVGEARAAGYSTWLRLSDGGQVPLP